MKIKKVVDLCKRSGRISLFIDNDGTQWISDGAAVYPMIDAPIFDKDSLCATFDITEKQQEGILFEFKAEMPDKLCFADNSENETYAERNDISLYYKNNEFYIYHSAAGALYMKAKYLNPLDVEGLEVYLRYMSGGQPYFACKIGFMLQAVIMPYQIEKTDEEFFKQLNILYEQTIRRKDGKED